MLSKKLFLILLIVFPVTFLSLCPLGVNGQIDLPDEDDEAEVETEGAALETGGAGFLEEEGDDSGALKPSPDAESAFLFTSETIAGRDTHILVGFKNRGQKDFVVESLEASFRYPLDFTFHIQNFSSLRPERTVRPGKDAAFHYAFPAAEAFAGRPLGLVVSLEYREGTRRFGEAVFNGTITVAEPPGAGVDGEAVFLYALLSAALALALLGLRELLSVLRKKSGASLSVGSSSSSSRPIETGTTASGVDYDWLPKGALDEYNRKSPKQSPKPRKLKRGAAKDE